jgi:hypothetical protein
MMKVKFKTIERAKAKKLTQAHKHAPLPWRSEPEYLSAERKARTYYTIIFSGDGKFMARVLDQERNGGTCYGEDWPTDIPYTGSAGNGDQYDGCEFACDGKEYREVSVGIQGGYLVDWDAKLNEPGDRSLAAIRLYHDVNERACELLGMRDPAAAKMEPLTDTKAAESGLMDTLRQQGRGIPEKGEQ